MGLQDRAKSVLTAPWAFDLYQALIGAPNCHRHFIADHVRPQPGDRLIDFGCGLGVSLKYLPGGLDYLGIDISRDYIVAARRRFGDRGRFIWADLETVDLSPHGQFDLAISFGVVHHLTDQAAQTMARQAGAILKPGGRLVTIDPVYVPDMPRLARFLIDHDRGTFPRDEVAYERLFEPYGQVKTRVVAGLLRVPYTQLVLTVTF